LICAKFLKRKILILKIIIIKFFTMSTQKLISLKNFYSIITYCNYLYFYLA